MKKSLMGILVSSFVLIGAVCLSNGNTIKSEAAPGEAKQKRHSVVTVGAVYQKTVIDVSSAPTEMQIGDTITPEYELINASDQNIFVTSSEPSVVSITDDGGLKAVSEGVAVITVETSEASAQYTVTVKEAWVEMITFDEDVIKLHLGQEKELKANIVPESASDSELEYTSENDDIASFNGNKIKAHAVGRVNIKVRAKSGSEANITVEISETLPEEIKTDKEEVRVEINKTEHLTVQIIPESADNKEFTLSIANPEIAEIDADGNITPLQLGKTTILIEGYNMLEKEIPLEVYYVAVEEILLENESELVNKDIDTKDDINFVVKVLPETATFQEYEVVSSDEGILKAEDGQVKIVGAGNVRVTFNGHDGVSKSIDLKIVDGQKIDKIVIAAGVSLAVIVILVIVQIVRSARRKKK